MNRIRRFMQGRYGSDQLSLALIVIALILNLIANFTRFLPLSLLSPVLLAFCIFRFFSRSIEKRRAENQRFMGFWYKIRNCVLRQRDKMRQSKNFKFFKCPGCRNNLRVPKGKGKIYVTCPRCGQRFIKKT